MNKRLRFDARFDRGKRGDRFGAATGIDRSARGVKLRLQRWTRRPGYRRRRQNREHVIPPIFADHPPHSGAAQDSL